MSDRPRAQISSRKQPKQTRSIELIAAILEAAAQVLAKDGAQRFTTARVAEKAGVSIGSLYLYFPNKAAILFRLQNDEWRQTKDLLRTILENVHRPPYRDAPEAQEARASGRHTVQAFMREALPGTSDAKRGAAGDLITTTLSQVGKHFSASTRTRAEIETYADAMADMFCAYLRNLDNAAHTAER